MVGSTTSPLMAGRKRKSTITSCFSTKLASSRRWTFRLLVAFAGSPHASPTAAMNFLMPLEAGTLTLEGLKLALPHVVKTLITSGGG